jgi:hypothetical protein
MEASSAEKRGYGDKGRCVKYIHMYVDTGRVWTAGFHHAKSRSRLARVRGQGRCVKYIHMYVHTGGVWTAGFHHATSLSRLARGLKLMNRLFI